MATVTVFVCRTILKSRTDSILYQGNLLKSSFDLDMFLCEDSLAGHQSSTLQCLMVETRLQHGLTVQGLVKQGETTITITHSTAQH